MYHRRRAWITVQFTPIGWLLTFRGDERRAVLNITGKSRAEQEYQQGAVPRRVEQCFTPGMRFNLKTWDEINVISEHRRGVGRRCRMYTTVHP